MATGESILLDAILTCTFRKGSLLARTGITSDTAETERLFDERRIMGTGHCHCGAVRYEFDGKPVNASYCHCSLCRRLTGSAFGPYCEVPSKDLHWSGDDKLQKYNLTERYAVSFCRVCGAPLAATHSKWPDATYLLMGALEDNSGIVPQYHIFTGSKAPWYEIRDSLPQHERWREET